ncbi:hypothetical protein [Microlunatus sp. Gsoil 973]|uniref:hypothetical protein n=1 Tax=Microlunatus sp. Gsoil 973 TaxID=2672569 RepID=UPI0012B4C5DB|nr:hypothetical protein [Microlunatus sp. Gsoil 973]QGN34505.1 hypothetical protein GJV80_18660 [Microlunatus sp. Gsoil 973]
MTTGSVDVEETITDLTQLLTAIARQSLRDHRMPDVASVVTSSLVAAAADVGGPERLLGRPGPRAAACLRELLLGATGEHTDWRWNLITEAVTVSRNVPELIEDTDPRPGMVGLREAEDNASVGDCSDEDQLAHSSEAALTDLDRRYADSRALYAQRFVAAVTPAATDLLGLPLPPQVLVDDDLRSVWWDDGAFHKPVKTDAAVVCELSERVHAIVPLQKVDIRSNQPEPIEGS